MGAARWCQAFLYQTSGILFVAKMTSSSLIVYVDKGNQKQNSWPSTVLQSSLGQLH